MISNFPGPRLGHSDIGMVFTNTEKTRAKNQCLNNCTMIAFFQHLEAGKMLETALFEMPEALGMLLPVAWRLWNASSCGRRGPAQSLLRACSSLGLQLQVSLKPTVKANRWVLWHKDWWALAESQRINHMKLWHFYI